MSFESTLVETPQIPWEVTNIPTVKAIQFAPRAVSQFLPGNRQFWGDVGKMDTRRRDESWRVMVQSQVRGAGMYDASSLQACIVQTAGHFWALRAAQMMSRALVRTACRLRSQGATESALAKDEGIFWKRLHFLIAASLLGRDRRGQEWGLDGLGYSTGEGWHAGVRYLRWVHWHFVYGLQVSQQRTQHTQPMERTQG